MSLHKDDEFYMVLPSNASPTAHPGNTASDFTVSWDSPIELNPNVNWKVALTEMSYIYHPHSISSNLSIEYDAIIVHTIKTKHTVNMPPNLEWYSEIGVDGFTNQSRYAVRFQVNDAKHLVVLATYPCYIDEPGSKLNKVLLQKHDKMDVPGWGEYYIYELKTDLGKLFPLGTAGNLVAVSFPFEVTFYKFEQVRKVIPFPKDMHFTSASKMVEYVQDHCKNVFRNISIDTSEKITFLMANKVYRVKFYGGLNFILGFDSDEFGMRQEPHTFKTVTETYNNIHYVANHLPLLNRGIQNMYIYASCCAPMHVGHAKVPLLKNVFVDTSNDLSRQGHMRNHTLLNPMYVDVAASSMNSIEINIRNDAGNIISFPYGSISILTLHFKKFLQ